MVLYVIVNSYRTNSDDFLEVYLFGSQMIDSFGQKATAKEIPKGLMP